jgi:transcriptional regulator of arginine metabolism
MHPEKLQRHRVILDVLDRESIHNQEELRRLLSKMGLKVTQATLSRDLKELGVVKAVTEEGSYKYTTARSTSPSDSPVLRCRLSGNLLVLKTQAGLAAAVAYRIDAMGLPEILGTVAGEDTLLVVLAEETPFRQIKEEVCRRLHCL